MYVDDLYVPRAICNEAYVKFGLGTSTGIDSLCVEAVAVRLHDEDMDCRSAPALICAN